MPASLLQNQTDERFREVSGKTYVLTLLQSLIRRKLLVSVYLPDSDMQYTSTLLSIDTQGDTLELDELFPLSGHALLEKAGEARLFAHLGGAALAFTASLQEVEQRDGLFFFRLRIPAMVQYLQRRDGHRVVVSRLGIHAELYDHQGRVHKAGLQDISTGGISIGIPGEEGAAFHENGVYRCTLHLPGEEPFHCKLDISSKRPGQDGNLIIGASYVGLEARGEQALRRVVAELERRLLRLRWEPAAAPGKVEATPKAEP